MLSEQERIAELEGQLQIAERERDAAIVRAEKAEAERDEARAHSHLGCDAAQGGPHTVIKNGTDQFCAAAHRAGKLEGLREAANIMDESGGFIDCIAKDALAARIAEIETAQTTLARRVSDRETVRQKNERPENAS